MKLSDATVSPSLAVNDLAQARSFYEDKLGLEPMDLGGEMGVRYACADGTAVFLYPKPGAQATTETVAGWLVDDMEATVDELTARGVVFEQYGEPFNTDERGISSFPGGSSSWFKDPNGHILGLVAMD